MERILGQRLWPWCRLLGQRDELGSVGSGQLDAAGLPVRLRLFDALLARGDEVPPDMPLAHGLAAERQQARARQGGDRCFARREDQHLAALVALTVMRDSAVDDIKRALGKGGQGELCSFLEK